MLLLSSVMFSSVAEPTLGAGSITRMGLGTEEIRESQR